MLGIAFHTITHFILQIIVPSILLLCIQLEDNESVYERDQQNICQKLLFHEK